MVVSVEYVAAVLSSVCFGSASVLEQVGTKEVDNLTGINPVQYVKLLFKWQYVSGLVLDGLGFIFFLVAVRSLPLFFVQAVDTASIAVTAVAAHFITHVTLGFKEYRAMLGMLLGLAGLAFVATPETGEHADAIFRYSLLAAAGFAVVAAALLARLGNKKPTFLALLSGLSFCGVAVAGRVAPNTGSVWHIIVNPVTIALAVFGVLGMLLFSMALQKGSATITYAITFVTETIIPATIGVVFLGDKPRDGLWVILAASLAITVISTVFLAQSKDYTHAS